MSREGGGPNDPSEDDSGGTEEDWPPFEQDESASDDWNLEERQQELERKEEILREKEGELQDREREIGKRERQIDQREQKVLERREEMVDERDRIEEKEKELTQKEQELEQKAAEMDGREEEIKRLRDEIEEVVEGASGGGGGPIFSSRPRRAAAVLLGALGLLGFVGAPVVAMLGGNIGGAIATIESFTGGGFPQPFTSRFAVGLAVLLAVGGVVEILGSVFAARGQFWMFATAAAILGMMLFFPVGVGLMISPSGSVLAGVISMTLTLPLGLTATIFLTIGESQFR